MRTGSDTDRLLEFIKKSFRSKISLTRKEELRLVRSAQRKKGEEGRRARQILLHAHYRMVYLIARRYSKGGISLDDAFQEGLIGLDKAIDRFDSKKWPNIKLLTYAIWWIHATIQRAFLKNTRNVFIPVHVAQKVGIMKRKADKLIARGMDEPTFEDLLALAKVKPEEKALARNVRTAFFSSEISLDAPVTEEGLSLHEVLTDSNMQGQHEVIAEKEIQVRLREALHRLKPLEDAVLRYRLQGFTLKDIAEKVAARGLTKSLVTRERIRQIEENALQKLRKYTKNAGI